MSFTTSAGFGHGPFGHGASSGTFGCGPFLTFPFTPGFVHGEHFAYVVDVQRFQDTSEQRYLLNRQRGVILTYTFPFVSSGYMCQIRSFFQDAGGAYARFWAIDHRTGQFYLMRFGSQTLEEIRGPSMVRNLAVNFAADQADGTAPSGTAPV